MIENYKYTKGDDNFINVQSIDRWGNSYYKCINACFTEVTRLGDNKTIYAGTKTKYKTERLRFYIDSIWWNDSLLCFSVSGRYRAKDNKNDSVHICKIDDIIL